VLRAVRCFEDAEVQLDPRVTVIIGENGSGKTTLAEAVASLAAGDDEGLRSFPLRHGHTTGSIELLNAGSARPSASWLRTRDGDKRRRLPDDRLVLAYGRYRRVQFPEEAPAPVGGPTILGAEWSEAYTRARIKDDLTAMIRRRRTATLSRPDNHLLRDIGDYLLFLHEHRGDPVTDATWRRLSDSLVRGSSTSGRRGEGMFGRMRGSRSAGLCSARTGR